MYRILMEVVVDYGVVEVEEQLEVMVDIMVEEGEALDLNLCGH